MHGVIYHLGKKCLEIEESGPVFIITMILGFPYLLTYWIVFCYTYRKSGDVDSKVIDNIVSLNKW